MCVVSSISAQHINFKSTKLKNVLTEVSQQTNYNFIYSEKIINVDQEISISFDIDTTNISSFLNKLFKGTGIKYAIKGNQIVLSLDTTNKQTETRHLLRGVIQDESTGEAIPGATVRVKNSNNIAFADVDGKFEINVTPSDVVVFQCIGMSDKEFIVGKHEFATINMSPDVIALNDVVVTGYQTISKERATGSFDIVKKDQLSKATSSIATRLIGSAPGLVATQDAYGNPSFLLRGSSSLNAGSAPLVVVDGFAIEGDFSSINPNDVENISVLKDAAAASIWGAKSANGVIVITTKHGLVSHEKSKLSIDYSSFVKFSSKIDLDYSMDRASSSDAIDYEKNAFYRWGANYVTDNINTGNMSNGTPIYTLLNELGLGHVSQNEVDVAMAKYKTLDNTSQIKKYLLQNPFVHQENLSINLQSEKSSNTLSLLYENNKTHFKKSSSDKYIASFSNHTSVFKWLDFSFLANYTYISNDNSGLNSLPDLARYEMLVDEDGNLNNLNNGLYYPNILRYVPLSKFPYKEWTYNPITEINNRSLKSENINTRLQAALTFKIIKGLTIESKLQYEIIENHTKDLYGEKTWTVRNAINTSSSWDQTTNEVKQNISSGDILDQSRSRYNIMDFRNQINYNRVFAAKHRIAFVAGTEVSNRIFKLFSYPRTYGYNDATLQSGKYIGGITGSGLIDGNDWLGNKQTAYYTNTFGYTTDRYFSLYGNLSYTFDNKYTVSGSARTDASNLITSDPKYRYSPFWSVGASWQVGNEDFMKDQDVFDNLNLRFTYGYNGNVDKSTSTIPTISVGSSINAWTGEYMASVTSLGNYALRWEKTATWDIGTDFSLFKGKLYGKIDVYNKNSKDLIATQAIPIYNGSSSQKINSAAVTNKGLEFEIGSSLKIADNINWTGVLGVSYNKNKINKIYRDANYIGGIHLVYMSNSQDASYGWMKGYDMNTLWCFQYAGLVDDSGVKEPAIKYEDGTTLTLTGNALGDGTKYCVNAGTKVAPWSMYFNTSFKIYNFDLSFIITGKFGHKFLRQSFNYPYSWYANKVIPNSEYKDVINCDPQKMIPLPQHDNELNYFFWNRYYPYMSYLATNAGHIRMQEINLSYTIPAKIDKTIGLKNIQLFGQMNNLFSIYFNKYNEDPEYPKGSIYLQPSYTFGIKVQF